MYKAQPQENTPLIPKIGKTLYVSETTDSDEFEFTIYQEGTCMLQNHIFKMLHLFQAFVFDSGYTRKSPLYLFCMRQL